MKNGLYQIYDTQAELAVGPIMKHKATGAAVRDFYGLLNNKDTTPGQHPDDFRLDKVGEQDEDTGIITPVTPVQTITTGTEWREKMEKDEAIRTISAAAR